MTDLASEPLKLGSDILAAPLAHHQQWYRLYFPCCERTINVKIKYIKIQGHLIALQ
jgi:hypothetical protein